MIDFECDVCHRPIGPLGWWRPSPFVRDRAFAALCFEHATFRAKLTAWLQYLWARWTP